MASALARFTRIDATETGLAMVFHVMFTGPDTATIAVEGEIVVPVTGAEQPAAIRTMISDAIVRWPSQNGNTWSVAPTNITMPTFQKG